MNHIRYSKYDMVITLCISLIVMMMAAGRLTAGFPEWGDDPAAYMNEGIAIAEGRFWQQAEVNYYYHPSPMPQEAKDQQLVYVWGYPLLLAVVNKFAGFDRVLYSSVIWYKIPNVICEGLLTATGYLFFRRRFSSLIAIALSLLPSLDDELLRWVNIVGPDLWLMTIGLASFQMLECYMDLLSESEESWKIKKSNRKKAFEAIAYGALLWYAHELRLNGITITLACAFGHILFFARETKLRNKTMMIWHILPYIVLAFFTLFSEMILAPATGNTSDFSKASLGVFLHHCSSELFAIYYFFTDLFGLVSNVQVIRALVAGLMMMCGIGLVVLVKNDAHLFAFMIGSLLITAMLPYGQGIRYIFNIIPILILSLGYGIELVTAFAERNWNLRWASKISAVLLTVLVISSSAKQEKIIRENLGHWREPEGPVYSEQAIELYQYIQNSIAVDETIAFIKPRALYLNTQRRSFIPGTNNHITEEADYYLYLKNEPGMDVFSDPKDEMRLEFENDEFMLFSKN